MYYSRTDVRAFLVIAVLLVAASVCTYFWMQHEADPVLALSQEKLDSLYAEADGEQADARLRSDDRNGRLARDAQLFPFDPNHADSLTLRRLGLSTRHIHNMLAYRRKGGRWRSPDDFARLYGLAHEDFLRLRPYVRIAPADQRQTYVYEHRERTAYGVPTGDKPTYEHVEKIAEGTTIDLNTADTIQLKQVPGIGSYYARKIVAYRERLGGFVSARQVDDVEGLPAGASRWFRIDGDTPPRQLHINHATFKQIVRHPYISYEQTKAIVNHIRQYGPIHSWRDLRLYKEFTDDDFRRLTPYVSFK